MNDIQTKTDALAVGLSALCMLHCLLVPVIVIAAPSMASYFFVNEALHTWMVIAVIPVSAIALYNGWKQHRVLKISVIGALGLLILSSAAFLGHDLLSETWERYLTLAGTSIITLAHMWNYFLWKVEVIDEDNESEKY